MLVIVNWEYDLDEVNEAGVIGELPANVQIVPFNSGEADDEIITDYLSDTHGWLVNSWSEAVAIPVQKYDSMIRDLGTLDKMQEVPGELTHQGLLLDRDFLRKLEANGVSEWEHYDRCVREFNRDHPSRSARPTWPETEPASVQADLPF